jgi:hypothetical protein
MNEPWKVAVFEGLAASFSQPFWSDGMLIKLSDITNDFAAAVKDFNDIDGVKLKVTRDDANRGIRVSVGIGEEWESITSPYSVFFHLRTLAQEERPYHYVRDKLKKAVLQAKLMHATRKPVAVGSRRANYIIGSTMGPLVASSTALPTHTLSPGPRSFPNVKGANP